MQLIKLFKCSTITFLLRQYQLIYIYLSNTFIIQPFINVLCSGLVRPMTDISFINISDGKPLFLSGKLKYTNDLSIEHTKKYSTLLSQNSMNMLSFFIGDEDDEETFKYIYGKNSYIVNDNLLQIGTILNDFLV